MSPALVPIFSAAGIGVLVLLSTIGQWWGSKRGSKAAAPEKPRDVMIPTVSVADGQLIAEQVAILRQTNDALRERQHFEKQMLEMSKDNMALEREKIAVQREILIFTKQAADYQREAAASLDRIERNQNPPSPARR